MGNNVVHVNFRPKPKAMVTSHAGWADSLLRDLNDAQMATFAKLVRTGVIKLNPQEPNEKDPPA